MSSIVHSVGKNLQIYSASLLVPENELSTEETEGNKIYVH